MKSKKLLKLWFTLLTLFSLALIACGGGEETPAESEPAAEAPAAEESAEEMNSEEEMASDEAVTISYWLWDANQQPAYEQCADNFMAANPNITIEIDQLGWDDYWNGVSNWYGFR